MSSLITEEIRAKATEIYRGNDECMTQVIRLFKEAGFPNGLLQLRDMEECGYVQETGFMWLKQKEEIMHRFVQVNNRLGWYASEITGYLQEGKMKKLTGVKVKELFFWVTINEISLDSSPGSDKIVFKNNLTGFKKGLPRELFVLDETHEPETKEESKVETNEDEEVESKEVGS